MTAALQLTPPRADTEELDLVILCASRAGLSARNARHLHHGSPEWQEQIMACSAELDRATKALLAEVRRVPVADDAPTAPIALDYHWLSKPGTLAHRFAYDGVYFPTPECRDPKARMDNPDEWSVERVAERCEHCRKAVG